MSPRPCCTGCMAPAPLGPVFLFVHHGIQGVVLCPDCWERYSETRGVARLVMRARLAINRRRLRRR